MKQVERSENALLVSDFGLILSWTAFSRDGKGE